MLPLQFADMTDISYQDGLNRKPMANFLVVWTVLCCNWQISWRFDKQWREVNGSSRWGTIDWMLVNALDQCPICCICCICGFVGALVSGRGRCGIFLTRYVHVLIGCKWIFFFYLSEAWIFFFSSTSILRLVEETIMQNISYLLSIQNIRINLKQMHFFF